MFQRINKKELTFFLSFWIIGYAVIFISFLTILEPLHALRNSLGFTIPIILPVLCLDLLFSNLFPKRKYWLFGILALIILAGFGIANFYAIKLLVDNPEAESNTVLSILIFFLVFRGIKFFREGVKHEIELNKVKAAQMEASFQLKEVEALKIKAELNTLKSQINPHFLFNTLNSIYSLVLHQSENAGDTVLKLSSLMRYLLDQSNNDTIALSKEVEFIENYLELERIRLGSNCQVVFEVDQHGYDPAIPPLLFLPLVENCFKHGISTNKKNNLVRITLHADDQEIKFSSNNFIVPAQMESADDHQEKGLGNLKKRLEIHYPDKYLYEVSTQNDQYIAQLNLSN